MSAITQEDQASDKVKVYLQELQPVIELLDEGKLFGAESICEIIDARYPEQDAGSLVKKCRSVFSEIKDYISNQGQAGSSLKEIHEHYEQLKEQYRFSN